MTASVMIGRALRYADGSARGLLYHTRGDTALVRGFRFVSKRKHQFSCRLSQVYTV